MGTGTGAASLPSWRAIGVWLGLALVAWGMAEWWRIATTVEVFSSGGDVTVRAVGAELAVLVAIERLDAIAIVAGSSIDPPGGRRLRLTSGGATVLDERLPRRFAIPGTGTPPVGDWWVDELAPRGEVWRREIAVAAPFVLSTTITGRPLRDLELRLEGRPTVVVSFRRGLINDDLFVRDVAGNTLAVTSLDPAPGADLRHALAQLLAAAAIGLILLAGFATAGRLVTTRHGGGSSAAADVSSTWSEGWLVAGLAVTAAVLSAWLAGDVLARLPHQPDTVVTLLETRWLLAGRLWGLVSPLQPWLHVPFTYVVGERWIGHYPHGWPLLLAPALAIGLGWLAAPLLGAVQVVLVHRTGRLLLGGRTALLGAAFTAASPLARLLAGSYMSHTASSCVSLAALWALLTARRGGRRWPAFACGLALGASLGVRPLVAVAFAVICALVLLRDLAVGAGRPVRLALAAAGGGLVASLPVLVVNAAVTGSPFHFPYSLAGRAMMAPNLIGFGLRNLDAILAHVGPALHGWGWGWLPPGWVGPLALGACAVPLLRRPRAAELLLAGVLAILALAHLGARAHGLHGFGPRYWSEAFPALSLLAAAGIARLAGLAAPHRQALVTSLLGAALALSTLVALPHRLALYRGYNFVDDSLVRAVAHAGAAGDTLLLASGEWTDWAQAAPLLDPRPDSPTLVLAGPPSDAPELECLTGRRVWIWNGFTLRPASAHEARE